MTRPQYDESIAFLRRWSTRFWLLTAIESDRKSIDTRTFDPATEEVAAREWIEQQGASRNVYFSVNPPRERLAKKAEKTDVLSLDWLHVDVDPRVGEDLAAERDRILALLRAPAGLPLPTVVVFSGGGYQAFWRLAEPRMLVGSIADADEAARYNLRIEQELGGDNCHNVDRIMRLPGTLNRPNAKKRARGQMLALAHVVEWDESRVYDLAQFRAAPLVQVSNGGMGFGNGVVLSGNVPRVCSVDDLPAQLSERCKVAIVQGQDPSSPLAGDNTRSAWLFFVLCEMVRAGCSDELMYSVVTDSQFRISDSVLEKRSGRDRYARRQIERAREEAIDPMLLELNERHAVIADIGGKCRIVSEVYDHAMQRTRISFQSFEDFRNRYSNRFVEIGKDPKTGKSMQVAAGKWWLDHRARRQFETITFAPGLDVDGAYNLWKGFACEPSAVGSCALFLDHVRALICGRDGPSYEYLLGWMASAVQFPHRPGRIAVVLKGRMGSGKSVFARYFGSIFGRHFLPVTDSKHLVGHFNSHLQDCVVLFADEAFYAGDRAHEGVLKGLITEDTILVEPKGIDVGLSPNCLHIIMASDQDWAVPAGHDDRRFFVLNTSDARMNDVAYFTALNQEMRNGGREALLEMLLRFDLSSFDAWKRPRTVALQEEKLNSLPLNLSWWWEKLRSGKLLPGEGEWAPEVLCEQLQDDFLDAMSNWGSRIAGSPTKLGRLLARVCPEGFPRRKQKSGEHQYRDRRNMMKTKTRPWAYVFPTLEECRAHWERDFDLLEPWPAREPGEDADEHDNGTTAAAPF